MATSHCQGIGPSIHADAGFILRPEEAAANSVTRLAPGENVAAHHLAGSNVHPDTQPLGFVLEENNGPPCSIVHVRFDVLFRNVSSSTHRLSIFRADLRVAGADTPAIDMSLVNARIELLVRPRTTKLLTVFTDPRLIHPGQWHRFVLALRPGPGDLGLAQVEHNGSLIAHYMGDLG